MASGGLSAAFAAANRQEHHLAGLLADLKDASSTSNESKQAITDVLNQLNRSVADLQAITDVLNQLNRSVADLQALVQNEPASRRSHWRAKVANLQEKAKMHRLDLARVMSHQHEASVREQLFSRPENRLTGRSAATAAGGGLEQRFLQERNMLERADEQVAIAIGQAQASLHEMRRQRDTLKGTRTVLLSVLGHLGLSDTVLRLIRRRNLEDRVLVYAGMVVTTAVVALLIYYFRWR